MGNDDLLISDILVGPNPFADRLMFKTTDSGNQLTSVEVRDLNGRLILNKNLNGRTAEVLMDFVPSGIYSIRVNTGEGSFTKQCVKL